MQFSYGCGFPKGSAIRRSQLFCVRVTLAATSTIDVTVTGYIHKDQDEENNQDHPFSVTVSAGNLTGETSETFYETDPTASAVVTIASVSHCPDEATIASYSTLSHTYSLDLSSIQSQLLDSLANMFSLTSPAMDSMLIADYDPNSLDSVAYLVFYVRASNGNVAFGLPLKKENGTNVVYYKATYKEEDPESANAWACINAGCNSCSGKRFLGFLWVNACTCTGSGNITGCAYSASGSGFPWSSLIGLLGVLMAHFF